MNHRFLSGWAILEHSKLRGHKEDSLIAKTCSPARDLLQHVSTETLKDVFKSKLYVATYKM